MVAGLNLTGKNELHMHGRQMLAFIRKNAPVEKRRLILEFGADLDLSEIELCLTELEIGYNLKTIQKDGKFFYSL